MNDEQNLKRAIFKKKMQMRGKLDPIPELNKNYAGESKQHNPFECWNNNNFNKEKK